MCDEVVFHNFNRKDEIALARTLKSWLGRSQDGACRFEPEKEA